MACQRSFATATFVTPLLATCPRREELTNAETKYDRNMHSHGLDLLLPGRAYRLKVQARNLAGWGPYSDWSSAAHSTTLSGRPTVPGGAQHTV